LGGIFAIFSQVNHLLAKKAVEVAEGAVDGRSPKTLEQEESPPVEVVGKYLLAKTLFCVHINDLKFVGSGERDSGGETTLNIIYS
jgi:hypothetical protein